MILFQSFMKVHRNLDELPHFNNAVITIGSYDGVHAGHQTIIQRINDTAQRINGESILITFHPHPRLVVRPDDNSLKLLNTIDEKILLLEKYGVDHLIIAPFTKAFSQQSPEEYIEHFLVKNFQPKKIIIGYDHKFGNKRVGNIDLLKQYEGKYGFEVMEIQKQDVDSIVVSSTKIRNALLEGRVKIAAEWLNHPFMISGEVVYGQQLGRELGYPTANIQVKERHKLIPPIGIYAVQVVHNDQQYQGMLYIGNRPTLDGKTISIEVNIFDFDQNIYGQDIRVAFSKHIRADKKFEGLEALKHQLGLDKIATLEALKQLDNPINH